MANDGVVISDTAPVVVGNVTWLKIAEDGSCEWYEKSGESWVLVKSEDAPAPLDHTHPTHGDINFTGTISSGGESCIDSPGDGEYEVGQIESIKVRNGLIVGLTEK